MSLIQKLTLKYIHAVSIGYLTATNIIMIITFMTAFLTPEKAVIIYINKYKEANIELIIVLICTIISLISSWRIINGMGKHYKI